MTASTPRLAISSATTRSAARLPCTSERTAMRGIRVTVLYRSKQRPRLSRGGSGCALDGHCAWALMHSQDRHNLNYEFVRPFRALRSTEDIVGLQPNALRS